MKYYYSSSIVLFFLIGFLLEKTCSHRDEDKNVFSKIAKTTKTDKITRHRYDLLYDEFFSAAQIHRTKKILEIGLGCNMEYGPGESATIWPRLFPKAKVYFMEYDGSCVEKHKSQIDSLNITVFVGDQADTKFLQEVATEHGPFAVIIDDGGHSDRQMLNSLRVLGGNALSPGGIYFIEDMACNFENHHPYLDYSEEQSTADWGIHPLKNKLNNGGQRTNVGAPTSVIQMFVMELAAENYAGTTWANNHFKYVGCGRGICFFRSFTTEERKTLSY
jgi:hypothetical protein